ncbi:MAG: hypothetical protein RSD67_06560 [Oscillospiraceae bacterium]
MAITKLNENKIENVNTASGEIVFATATIADGFQIPFMGKDYKTLILIKGGSAVGEMNFLMGNSIQGITDLKVSVPAGKTIAITLDSGSFKNVTGEFKGYVLAKPSAADISVAVVELA